MWSCLKLFHVLKLVIIMWLLTVGPEESQETSGLACYSCAEQFHLHLSDPAGMPERKGRENQGLIGCCWTILDGVQKQCSHSKASTILQGGAVSGAIFRRLCPPEMDRLQLKEPHRPPSSTLKRKHPSMERGTARLSLIRSPSACLVSLAVSLSSAPLII